MMHSTSPTSILYLLVVNGWLSFFFFLIKFAPSQAVKPLRHKVLLGVQELENKMLLKRKRAKEDSEEH